MSGNNDCHESRFSIVSIVISVSNVTSPYDHSFRVLSNGGTKVGKGAEKSWEKVEESFKTSFLKSWKKLKKLKKVEKVKKDEKIKK